ncbi:hypothetical protein EC844_101217 [Acinetobacter calcoaceticus]|uniref:Uncharacterized protein n=1 Tax=Acinetobacter calcoaceticus TaxID=471 RepID=A0A4R1YA63_ACICA|nr:hypothetical protein EC844_101217 [Acinetobacter calcoaceticus]
MQLRLLSTLLLAASLTACGTVQSLYKKQPAADVVPATKIEQAASTLSPLQQIFKLQPDLSQALNSVSIQQVFNQVESPTAAQITVVQSGLMDDSVSAIRTIYQFKQQNDQWSLAKTDKSYQCARGSNSKAFQTKLCP